jgi:S-adenosylmethionine hydrolase
MVRGSPIITLLSDFGLADGYVAAMKGALLGVVPGATLVDVTHEIPPQDVLAGALMLAQTAPAFPPDTVHLAVVDPGVGGEREPIVIETETARFVGPNNGLLSWAARRPRVVHCLREPAFCRPIVSATFHGRDVFAPAAGFLARGVPVTAMGPPLEEERVVEIPWPQPRREEEALVGEVLSVDRFGNLTTNLTAGDPLAGQGGAALLEIAGRLLDLQRTYVEVEPRVARARGGASGFIEIAVRTGSAAVLLGAGRGTVVRLRGGPR